MMTRGFQTVRGGALVAGVALSLAALAGCGSDDDSASPEEAFCAAGDSLRSDLGELANLDIIAGGTDALNESVDAIEADLDALQESGSELASDEINALQSSFDQLNTAVDELGESISIDNASAIVESIAEVATAASAAYDVFSEACS